ncbi:MAG: RNA polymerase sigma factor [Candidatus Pacebacteria bacterium]|nr:RNA polymerase sigma factor [Candidatus Paceibacterota bacterium]
MEAFIDCKEKTDEELISLAAENTAYFSCIIERYEKKLKRYVRRITKISDDDVEDVLQEIFIKVYMNIQGFDTKLSFSSWIYRIAHNTVISMHRKLQSRPEGHMVDIEDDKLFNIVDTGDIEHETNTKYLKEHLAQAIDNIPQKYQDVIILRFFEEKDYKEISDILQKPMGSVATLINRAKDRLKKEFISLGYSKQDYEK